MNKTPKLMVLTGPTGVGKTALALELAAEFNAEIIGADSGQVYQGFDIGTAKPTAAECQQIPHHCIDIWSPTTRGDAVLWQRAADQAIKSIHAAGKRVLIVGGTGFYLQTLLYGLVTGPDPDPELRERLLAAYEQDQGQSLYIRLQAIDPVSAERLHAGDPVRVVRAVEYYEQTGRPISAAQAEHGFQQARYQHSIYALTRERALLYERINQRTEAMLAGGWIEEAESLYQKWGREVPPFQLIGYRELKDYFEGQLNRSELTTAIQQATRRYAKRQLTWFRRMKAVEWIEMAPKEAGFGQRLRDHFLSD